MQLAVTRALRYINREHFTALRRATGEKVAVKIVPFDQVSDEACAEWGDYRGDAVGQRLVAKHELWKSRRENSDSSMLYNPIFLSGTDFVFSPGMRVRLHYALMENNVLHGYVSLSFCQEGALLGNVFAAPWDFLGRFKGFAPEDISEELRPDVDQMAWALSDQYFAKSLKGVGWVMSAYVASCAFLINANVEITAKTINDQVAIRAERHLGAEMINNVNRYRIIFAGDKLRMALHRAWLGEETGTPGWQLATDYSDDLFVRSFTS